jgi:hypothetical protein
LICSTQKELYKSDSNLYILKHKEKLLPATVGDVESFLKMQMYFLMYGKPTLDLKV